MLLIVVWLAVLGWNYLFRIGVYGGDKAEHYKPSQPINFNHTLHAGADNLAISCQYCHSSAEKSKHADPQRQRVHELPPSSERRSYDRN